MSSRYNSSAALRSPPHITLVSPFWWIEEQINRVVKEIELFSEHQKRFTLHLSGFDTFKPKVIFIKNEPSEDLIIMQKELSQIAKDKLNIKQNEKRPFHPHMTIAFKDISNNDFLRAWGNLKEKVYNTTFQVSSIHLLMHSEERWEVLKSFDFKG